jgi:PAS domain S-box-containing protein
MTDIEQLRLIESIIERSPAIIFRWIIQEGWPVEFVSKNVTQLGYSQDDILSGKVSWPRITHPDDVPRLEKEVEGFLAAGLDSWSQTYRIRTADGLYHWMRDWNLLLRDIQGVPRRIQGIIIDITKEKTEEQQRERAQKELALALESVISGFVPICSYCKAIRDGAGNWTPIENYINQRHPVQFSHGCCPKCYKREVEDLEAPNPLLQATGQKPRRS